MFFERDAAIRAGDSHGDIVFWPLLALAQYLIASGDAAILDEPVAFYERGAGRASAVPLWQHVQRALALIERRVIAGTALAAYGHGDWNDALQPADPAMREHMCSAWTVTLHYQMLTTLARALRQVGREPDALRLESQAEAVRATSSACCSSTACSPAMRCSTEGAGVVRHVCQATTRDAKDTQNPLPAAPARHDDRRALQLLAMIHAILEDLLDARRRSSICS